MKRGIRGRQGDGAQPGERAGGHPGSTSSASGNTGILHVRRIDWRYMLFVALVTLTAIIWRATTTYPTGVFDLYPLYYGAKAWLQTGDAYALESVAPIADRQWDVFKVGNAYPLPAVLLILPLTILPPTAAAALWIGLLTVGFLLALRLAGLSPWWAFALPVVDGIRIEQFSILTIIGQIVALWALRARRPWLLALCCAVILTKPNQGLFFVIAVAILARNWRQQAVVFALFWGGSFLLDPNWLAEWLPTLDHYRTLTHQPILWGLALFALPFLYLRDWLAAATILQFLTLPFPTNSTYALGAVPLTVLDSRRAHWLTLGSYCWLLLVPLVGRPWAMALAVLLPTAILALARRHGWPFTRRGVVALGTGPAMVKGVWAGNVGRATAPAVAPLGRAAVGWWGAVAGLVVATVVLRLPYLDVPISADEGGYATAAYWWARGDTLYREITITRPQGIFVAFRLIDALGLGSVRGIHLVAAAWVAASALALLAVAARLWGRAVGLASAALYALVMATPWMQGYSANAELFMTLPLLLGIGALLRADDAPLGARPALGWLVASGVAGAVALLLKPAGVALLPLAACWLVRRWRAERAPRAAWLAASGALLLGWVAGLLPALLHGLLTVPDRYLGAVLLYRLGQDSVVGGALGHQLDYFATNTLYLAGHLPPLLLAPFGVTLAAHGGDRRARAFLALWLLTALGGTALGGNWFLHYYQQLLPPLAVATVLVGRWLLRRPISPPRFAMVVLAALALLVVVVAAGRGLVAGVDPRDLPEWEPSVSAAAPVAAYLAANSAPTDTVYVAYDHADIYYLARRRPAARWLHFRELRGTPGAFAEQVARIADPATAPRYIVGAQAFDRFGFDADGALRAVVARDYALETTIADVPIYRRTAGP